MRIELTCSIDDIGNVLARDLSEQGHRVELIHREPSGHFVLRRGRDVDLEDLQSVREALRPFQPPVRVDPDLPSDMVHIELERASDEEQLEAEMGSDSGQGLAALGADLTLVDVAVLRRKVAFYERPLLVHAGADPFVIQTIQWLASRRGIELTVLRSAQAKGSQIVVYCPDATRQDMPDHERFSIVVRTGCEQEAAELVDKLTGMGCEHVSVEPIEQSCERFTIELGPLRAPERSRLAQAVMATATDTLARAGINLGDYPLRKSTATDPDGWTSAVVVIDWPLAAGRAGSLPPYGPCARRQTAIRLHCDDRSTLLDLTRQLREAGHEDVEPIFKDQIDRGFTMHCNRETVPASTRADVASLLQETMHELALPRSFELRVHADRPPMLGDDEDSQVLEVYFPAHAAADGTLVARLSDPQSRYDVRVHGTEEDDWSDVVESLESWGFSSVYARGAERSITVAANQAVIHYGGAHPALIARIEAQLREEHGVETTRTVKRWDDNDQDIWIYLGRRGTRRGTVRTAETSRPSSRRLGFNNVQQSTEPGRPFIEQCGAVLRVGEILLERRQDDAELSPSLDAFRHFCIDLPTAETLAFAARAVALGEPCLLEGDTGTSKTSSLIYLAAHLGQPVIRLNLNGQTDTSELIGRFIPGMDTNSPLLDEVVMPTVRPWLAEQTQAILDQAQSKKRTLTRYEQEKILSNEGLPRQAWSWVEGAVLTAMKRGWWLVLDEVNLAEPQVLERLNPVLEDPASLVVSERDGERIAPHPAFRIFATMNPSDYAGRRAFSPAFMDRWQARLRVPAATQSDYLAMLQTLVFGSHPEVSVEGRQYGPNPGNAIMDALAAAPEIEELLKRLADFHASACVAAKASDRGGLEGIAQSRRTLLRIMAYLAWHTSQQHGSTLSEGLREALTRYYLARVSDEETLATLVAMLDAAGIGPNEWSLASTQSAPNPAQVP